MRYALKAAFHWRGLFAGLLLAAIPSAHLITAPGTLTFKTSDEIDCGENHHEDEAVSDKRSRFDDTHSGCNEPRPRVDTRSSRHRSYPGVTAPRNDHGRSGSNSTSPLKLKR